MDLQQLTKIDLEKAVLEDLGREVQASIDEQMSYHFMMMYWKTQEGWTTIKLSRFQDNNHAVDISYWLEENGFEDRVDYYRDGAEFIFQNPKHATMFSLRWAG